MQPGLLQRFTALPRGGVLFAPTLSTPHRSGTQPAASPDERNSFNGLCVSDATCGCGGTMRTTLPTTNEALATATNARLVQAFSKRFFNVSEPPEIVIAAL